MNLIIIVYVNPFGIITTKIKWGKFKYAWYGSGSTFFAIKCCSNWLSVAKRVKIIYSERPIKIKEVKQNEGYKN